MKQFMDRDFVLENDTARRLYHEHAAGLPIIDYHCHLDPAMIARDHRFDNLGEAWLAGDHYKWRAMRSNGVDEHFITGGASDREKFEKWAETVPYTMRNPLYHWTHLELRTAFGVEKLLGPATAREIYDECTEKLRTPEYSVRGLMRRYGVEVVCTTDDPADSLEHHAALREEGFEIRVLPTWRPDRAMATEDPAAYRAYIERLGEASRVSIGSFADLLEALGRRHDFFHEQGCRLSDHGTDGFYADDFTDAEAGAIFDKVYGDGKALSPAEANLFRSAMMYHGALADHAKGWVQQFHYGPLRNNNTRMMRRVGPDTGFDSIGDGAVARAMALFLDRLDVDDRLAKTIIYNLNPCDNHLVATMIGNFQQGPTPGKIQFGSGWWFLDQRDGMEAQLGALSNLGLLSRFVGMLTDSRSFLSYPRHEYFRRIVCNLLGSDVERGLLPASEMEFIGRMVENISYRNAKNYFDFQPF